MTERPSVPRRRFWIVSIALVAGLAGLIVAFWSVRGPALEQPPDPNGYADLVEAGAIRQGDWPSKGDLARATIAEIRPFVEANRRTLQRARLGLSRPCLVPIEDSPEGLNVHFQAMGRVRDVSRILEMEARVLQADGAISAASKVLRELLELGQVAAQGGVSSDAQMGWVIQEKAIGRIQTDLNKLSVADSRALLIDLGSLDHRRVTQKALDDRWARWYRGAYGPVQRTLSRWSGMEGPAKAAETSAMKKSRDRIERALHYLQIQVAIHAFHVERHAWPRSVNELVPKYLESVPIDPRTSGPLAYPANPDGSLTDDVGSIARPDGGVTPPP